MPDNTEGIEKWQSQAQLRSFWKFWLYDKFLNIFDSPVVAIDII
jgi:hypothetical protein